MQASDFSPQTSVGRVPPAAPPPPPNETTTRGRPIPSAKSAQSADELASVLPTAIADGIETLRILYKNRVRMSDEPKDWQQFNSWTSAQMLTLAINIAIRDTRDQIRELEIRRSRGLPPDQSRAREVVDAMGQV